MKKISLLLFCVILSSCATTESVPNRVIKPELNIESISGIGDVFFEFTEYPGMTTYEFFVGKSAAPYKYDLTIIELNDDRVGFQYAEYVPEALNVGSQKWLIKQGFNKTFTYQVKEKIIRFKGYEFEILGVEAGLITYRRIK